MERTGEKSDQELLLEFANAGSEQAFAAIVGRHVGLVYSAAFRVLNDSHLAEDVAQAVFVLLARKARSLRHTAILSGWLYRSAHFVASDLLKSELRRRKREETAGAPLEPEHLPDRHADLQPHLDHALMLLSAPDRAAILLRFFEEKSLREVGQVLNVSEEAARKRVDRALDRLRKLLSARHGTVTPALVLELLALRLIPPAGVDIRVQTAALAQNLAPSVLELVRVAVQRMLLAKLRVITAASVGLVLATLLLEETFYCARSTPTTEAAVPSSPEPPRLRAELPHDNGLTGRVGTACMNCHRPPPGSTNRFGQ